ncbi:MAG: hypothetical protein ACTHLR_02285 [Rhizomicrobium sp.]
MSGYNLETINVQFLNQSFLDKIDQGLTKEAGVAISAFVRQKLREDGFTRKVLNPITITAAELDRQITEEPTVIVEKEPDSVAANLPFLGRAEIRYWKTARYPVTFQKITSAEFKKSKFELATYRTDIRTVLQENSVKDLQKQEDQNFYANILAMANANSNNFTLTGGFTKANLMAGIKNLLNYQLPVGCILMTQSMYADLLTFPATDVGSPAASDLFRGQGSLDTFFGYKIITTNKADILPTNQCIVFAPQEYLGQFYALQDATVFLKVEQDIIDFTTYEAVGVGIGNVNGAIVLNF